MLDVARSIVLNVALEPPYTLTMKRKRIEPVSRDSILNGGNSE